MADDFSTLASGLDSPAANAYAITPHDSNNEAKAFRSLYIGVAGNVVIVTLGGTAVTFKGAVAGSVIPVRGVRVNSTNTTATDMVGLY